MTDILGPTNAPGSVTARPADTRTGFGVDDTWMKDCTSADAEDGTEIEAGWLNAIIANARQLTRANGVTGGAVNVVTEDNGDDLLKRGVQHLIQRGQPQFALDTGAANAIIATFAPALAEHKLGQVLRLRMLYTNTGPTTINPNGLGVKNVLRLGGAALRPGDLQSNGMVELAYDGTQYQIISGIMPLSAASTQAAPKMIGILANAAGAGTVVATSTSVLMNFGTTVTNNLFGSSTWNGTSLTIGAAEGGLWNVSGAIHMPAPAGGFFSQASIHVNGTEVAFGCNPQGNVGDAACPVASSMILVVPGDVVTCYAYQQTGGSITTNASQRSRFSAFLTSAV